MNRSIHDEAIGGFNSSLNRSIHDEAIGGLNCVHEQVMKTKLFYSNQKFFISLTMDPFLAKFLPHFQP